ncbi:MAG TPA: tetratricopeptide repeat protein [Stellaceae bacterium]|nr:tetratricopeptide repeat protein [Stellaceae bacterium]
MNWKTVACVAACVVVGLGGPSSAQTNDELWKHCEDDNADLSIGGCTAIIQAGQETTQNLAIAFYNRGSAYYRKSQYGQAIADFDQALRLAPDYGEAYDMRANAYSDKGDHQHAIQDYDQALRVKPNDPRALNNRGDEYRILGQYDRALQDLNESLRLRPNNASTLLHRGVAYAAKGRNDLAIRDYDQVIGLTPKDADAYYNRSLAKRKTGDVAGANADLARAKQLDPSIGK